MNLNNNNETFGKNSYYPDGSLMCEYEVIERGRNVRKYQWTWFCEDGEISSRRVAIYETHNDVQKETIEEKEADGTLIRRLIKVRDSRRRSKEKYLYLTDGSLDTVYSMSLKVDKSRRVVEKIRFYADGTPACKVVCRYGKNSERDVVVFYKFNKNGTFYHTSGRGESFLDWALHQVG